MTTTINPARGEIWEIRFDPSEGDEIQKSRPAIVMTVPHAGRMKLHIVVPITGWRDIFVNYLWMVKIEPNPGNGLSKESAADTFQTRSLAFSRFRRKLGELEESQLAQVAAGIAFCVGYRPLK